jgi:anti-anti-sigma regulatory factor
VRLIDAGTDVLEVDLAEVRYLSPDGCAALFAALRAARAHSAQPAITHSSEQAQSVLHQIGLTRALAEQGD